MMILTATEFNGQTIFRDDGYKDFYTLKSGIPKCEGSRAEFARDIVKEAMILNVVMKNPTSSGSGWAWSLISKLNHRMDELKTALMDLLIDEAITLSIEEKQNETIS